MTRKELQIREKAVLAAYKDLDIDRACQIEMQLLERNSSFKFYRFRPPRSYELDALNKAQIYMCRPDCYEDDGDCGWIDNIQELVINYIPELKKACSAHGEISNTELCDRVVKRIYSSERYKHLCKVARDQCLISCMTDKISDYMWEKYAEQSKGVCFEYDCKRVLEAIAGMPSVRFFPVWYVENRTKISEIQFGVKDYEHATDTEMYQKYVLSCMVKNRVPYAQESEWRIFYADPNYDFRFNSSYEKGKLFDFIKPDKIYLGKNIGDDYKLEFEAIAKKNDICVEQIR